MRMKRKNIILSLLLTAVLIVTQNIVCAENLDTPELDPIPLDYQTVAQISAALSITGNTAKCTGRVSLQDTYTGTLIVTLQRKNGNSWVNVKSWSGNVPAGGSKKVEGTYSLSIHAAYRVKVNLVSVIENVSMYSYTKTY